MRHSSVDPADLFWDGERHVHDDETERHDSIGDVLQSLAETSARCRSLSRRALAATRPDHPGALSARRPSSLRPPEPGTTDVVELQSASSSGTRPRPPTFTERERIAAALRPPRRED